MCFDQSRAPDSIPAISLTRVGRVSARAVTWTYTGKEMSTGRRRDRHDQEER